LEGYDINDLALGAFTASHSALDVCEGAQSEGLRNFAVAMEKREKTYTKAFRTRQQGTRRVGVVQNTYVVKNWNQVPSETVIKWIRKLSGVGVPNRSSTVYLRNKIDGTYNSIMGMKIPMFGGNPHLLRAEERALPYKLPRNQDFLAEKANLPVPPRVDTPEEINRPFMIKASQFSHVRDFERGFVVVNSFEEYQAKLDQLLQSVPEEKKAYAEEVFRSAPIQEYVKGELLIDVNFFYSSTWEDLEPLGTDTRKQFGNFEEAIHIPISLRESLWEQAIEMAYVLLDTVKKYYPPGIVGPFAIQCMGDAKERLRPIDLCFRIAGSPDIGITPSANYLHGNGIGKRVDFGRRIAMELKDAVEQGTLSKVLM
jgi:5-formaminoimidazole-4-carboxamide-1-(beta)-D-ribofuranosyl 5'-monophosphate synthetase